MELDHALSSLDLSPLMNRRNLLRLLAGAGVVTLAACASSNKESSNRTSSTATSNTATTADANYLRGVQTSDRNGVVTFESIFPACYSGRWPHIHFEVYSSLDHATGGGDPIATSQVAIPATACDAVFATAGYDQSVQNLAEVSLTSDMVFSDDGGVRELARVTGNITDGYKIALTVPV